MSELKTNVKNTFNQLKTKLAAITAEDADTFKKITIDVDAELHKLIQHAAKREETTEQAILLRAAEHFFETRALAKNTKLSPQQKENNPLLQLDGLTKTIQ